MIGSTGDREASVPFRVPVLLVGWGVRSIHAPENRFVVGLRVACAKALEIAVSAKHPILDRSQNPTCRCRLCRGRHRNQRHLSANRRFRLGAECRHPREENDCRRDDNEAIRNRHRDSVVAARCRNDGRGCEFSAACRATCAGRRRAAESAEFGRRRRSVAE
jgi:hypothetical protein